MDWIEYEKSEFFIHYYNKQDHSYHKLVGIGINYRGIYFYKNGVSHCLEGPACIMKNGAKEYWVNGKRLDCKTDEEFKRLINLKAFW